MSRNRLAPYTGHRTSSLSWAALSSWAPFALLGTVLVLVRYALDTINAPSGRMKRKVMSMRDHLTVIRSNGKSASAVRYVISATAETLWSSGCGRLATATVSS